MTTLITAARETTMTGAKIRKIIHHVHHRDLICGNFINDMLILSSVSKLCYEYDISCLGVFTLPSIVNKTARRLLKLISLIE